MLVHNNASHDYRGIVVTDGRLPPLLPLREGEKSCVKKLFLGKVSVFFITHNNAEALRRRESHAYPLSETSLSSFRYHIHPIHLALSHNAVFLVDATLAYVALFILR
jgi:hypothetical protein